MGEEPGKVKKANLTPTIFSECYAWPLSPLMSEKRKAITGIYDFYAQLRDTLYSDLDYESREEYIALWKNILDQHYLHRYTSGTDPLFIAIQKFDIEREKLDFLLAQILKPIPNLAKNDAEEIDVFFQNTAMKYADLLLQILHSKHENRRDISYHIGLAFEYIYLERKDISLHEKIDFKTHYKKAYALTADPYSWRLWFLRAVLKNHKALLRAKIAGLQFIKIKNTISAYAGWV